MKINELKNFIASADACGHVPLIRALHGIGKSASCVQYAIENNLHYEPLILSLMDVGDLLGLPMEQIVGGQAATSWAAPSWYVNIVNAAWPEILEYDELEFHDKEFEKFVIANT